MLLIAHRGLCAGPDPSRENHPDEIAQALLWGFCAEVDVWLRDGSLWLGHDQPTYQVPFAFLNDRRLFLHAKNIDALDCLLGEEPTVFFHDRDDFTLTSNGHIWTYPGKPLTPQSICVQPEWDATWRTWIEDVQCYGICSKFVHEIETLRSVKTVTDA